MKIDLIDRGTGQQQEEEVYGGALVNLLYGSNMGRSAGKFIPTKLLSQLYGLYNSSLFSRMKVSNFIEKYNVKIDEYQVPSKGFNSFNDFFIRRFKKDQREFKSNLFELSAPCEARYLAYESVGDDLVFPVKGRDLSAKELLKNESWFPSFAQGPMLIARLCPVDYHRFHYPIEGQIMEHFRVKGPLQSVNPMALKFKSDIFITNERQVSILETELGFLAYVEVGALMVGKIIQTSSMILGKSFKLGEEKGYFKFGGSTVILLGEKGRWKADEDLLENTKNNKETFVKLGDKLASKLNRPMV